MIGKIKYIADMPDCQYERGTFDEFISWLRKQWYFQFDIETTVCKWWNEFDIISMQFGSCTHERVQWFLQWSEITPEQKAQIKEILESQRYCKLIHNAAFEYVVCRFHDIIIENVYDTMLGEKILRGGMENENYKLADITWKYLRIMMDKTLQKSFGDNIITPDKVHYGITDVAYLDCIRTQQLLDARDKNLLNVFGLEMEAVLTFSDITYEGMLFDHVKWRENIELAKPLVASTKATLEAWFQKEPIRSYAIIKGFISDYDRVTVNYNSPVQKKELLQLIFPDIQGAGLPILNKYIQTNGHVMEPEQLDVLVGMRDKDYSYLQTYLFANYREEMIAKGYLITAGTVTVNWNSWQQTLPLFQLLVPKLTGTGEDERNKHPHQILKDYEAYQKAVGLVTDYGEDWITKYVGPDGYVRTNFNQIVSTGRSSSSNPNMQNIIVTEEVGTRYRNAFICEPGWTFVDSDYTGQELALIAWASKDPVWIGAIERGEDIHSIVAELMFSEKWRAGTEPTCEFSFAHTDKAGKFWPAGSKLKCSCKKHKPLRYDSKAIDFGLAYGMSEIKLSADLKVSRQDALNLLNKFFEVFPGIKATLDYLGHFGVRNGYIMTLWPFNRKRWFPYWKDYLLYRDAHIEGIKYIPTLGEIERASKNQPIQGSAADMMKVAMVMTRNYIRDNNLRHLVKFQAQVHDQLTTKTTNEFADEWMIIFDNLMFEAGKLIIPSGILKAETQKSPVWTK